MFCFYFAVSGTLAPPALPPRDLPFAPSPQRSQTHTGGAPSQRDSGFCAPGLSCSDAACGLAQCVKGYWMLTSPDGYGGRWSQAGVVSGFCCSPSPRLLGLLAPDSPASLSPVSRTQPNLRQRDQGCLPFCNLASSHHHWPCAPALITGLLSGSWVPESHGNPPHIPVPCF